MTAFATTHTSSFNFAHGFTGAKRSYKGKHMKISATCEEDHHCPGHNTYNVTLKRNVKWGIDDKIGTKKMDRCGYDSATWTNVGSGTYYFVFSKSSDWVTLSSENVTMRSYN